MTPIKNEGLIAEPGTLDSTSLMYVASSDGVLMWPFNSQVEMGRLMKLKQQPTAIALDAMDRAFREKQATGIAIYRCNARTWIFTFAARNPGTGKMQSYTLKTQRGKVRTWSDPRNLLQWLSDRYGVREGSFVLLDEEH